MFNQRTLKKLSKGLVSVLLVLVLLIGLVPALDFTVFAEEEAAEGSQIYAFLNKIDPSRTETNGKDNLELVFKNENVKDSNYFAGPYTDFADTEFVITNYKFDNNGRPNASWNYQPWNPVNTPAAALPPWHKDSANGQYIRKVTFRNKIAPKSIAGWFYNCRYLCKFENFENLDTSKCENMSYAFWYTNTSSSGTRIYDGGENLTNQVLTTLNLSKWDTSNVKKIDYFIYSTRLQNLNLSGLDLTGIDNNIVNVTHSDNYAETNGVRTAGYPDYRGAIRNISSLVYNCTDLQSIKLDGLNLSKAEYISAFIVNSGLSKIDLSKVVDPKNTYQCESFLRLNEKLTDIIFGTEDDPLEIGVTPKYLGLPRNGYDNPFTPEDESEGGTVKVAANNPYRSNAVWLGTFFSGCASLKTIDLEHLKINYSGEDYNDSAAGLESGVRYQLNDFFKNCKALEEIRNLDNLGCKPHNSGNWVTRGMFSGCESLSEIDLSNFYALLGGPYIFENCSSLKKLDISGMGRTMVIGNYSNNSIYDQMSKGFQSYDNESAGKKKSNVFEGCTELSEITFSPYYYGDAPQAEWSFNTSSKTPKTADEVLSYTTNAASWYTNGFAKDIPPVGDDVLWTKIKHPKDLSVYNHPSSTTNGFHLTEADLYPVGGEPKTTMELFGDFKPEYAGTWVRVDKIALDGNGGSPRQQTFVGAAGVKLDPNEFDKAQIQDPVRVGYVFLGWYATDDQGVEHNLADQLEANRNGGNEVVTAWRYYAKWKENHYTLKLNGNGGTTEIEGQTVGEFTANDNLAFSEFYELSSNLFTREGYVLSGWNTRSNGAGDEFSANDSVNKLTSADKGEATLYAQWHKPDVILSFNVAGGSEVSDRNYTLTNDPQNPTRYGNLAESAREGYTFLGWYTEPNGGTKITANMEVDPHYSTLYAQWIANPTIVFDANGYDSNDNPVAYFNNNPDQHNLPKYYRYNQNLGVLPTPQYGSAVLKGWYTQPSGGEEISSATVAIGNRTYYAHWGYRPQFETNGGSYTNFPAYEVQEGSSVYTLETLPTIVKENNTFEGWYFNGNMLNDGAEVDLSSGSIIEARWTANDSCAVTLDVDGGKFTGTAKSPIYAYSGNAVGELPTPVKTGYDFLGWYNGDTLYTHESVINSDITLTARWSRKDWTVTFDAGEGALFDEADATRRVRDNGKITDLPGANRSDTTTSYSFDGWFYNDGEERRFTADTLVTKDIDCYAKWTSAADRFEHAYDSLYSYTVKWNTPSNEYATNIDDNLVVAPQSGNSALSVMLFVEFDFNNVVSGQINKTLAPYSVKILVPKYAFENSAGEGIGSDNINAGLTKYVDSSSDSEGSDFVYKDNDPNYPGYYVITNNNEIDGTNQTQMFRITYEISPSQIRSIDGGYTDENGYFSGNYYQNTLPVSVLVDRELDGVYNTEDGDTDYTKNLGIEVHTDVKTTATKTQSAASFEWSDSWGERPDDADQYFYITWTLMSVHDSSSSQKFMINWSENTVHDGTVVLVRKDTGSGWQEKDTFKTTVVTKHTRRPSDSGWKMINNEAILDVEYLSGHHDKYRVSGTAGVYLLPEGDMQYEKYIKDYTRGANRIKNGAQDKILARQAVDNLSYEIAYREYKNTDNATTWNEQTKRYNTPERNIVIADGTKGNSDVVLSTVKGSDRYTWNATTEKALSDSDYSFDTLTVYMTEYDAVNVKTQVQGENVWEWSEPYVHRSLDPQNPYVDYTDVEIWTRSEGENDFRLYKTLTNSDFSETHDDESTPLYDEIDTYGVVYSNVTLPEKTVGYQVRHKSEFFTTKLFINANMCLNSSNKVLSAVREDVSNGYNSLIKNNCTLNVSVWDENSGEYVGKSGLIDNDSKDLASGGASICSYELAIGNSYICADKRCQKVNSDGNYGVTVTSNYEEFPALICGWGYTDTEDAVKLIESGEFNDLLPYNFTVDKNSVYVVPILGNVDGKSKRSDGQTNTIGNYVAVNQYNTKRREALPSAYYSVEFTENWEDSGRTMMTIKVNTPDNVPATGYYAFYKMKTSIANISANGLTQSSYVSFTDTTENQSPPIAKEGNISGVDSKFAPYYKSIDNDFTAFANATTDMAIPSTYATGIKSAVKSEGEFVTKDVTVGLDSDYTYNVTFTNSQPANNIVIYDVLVNSLNGQTYDWNGDFGSVEISSLTSDELVSNNDPTAHMAPVIYYCIKEGDLVESDLNIDENPSIWTSTEPADKSTIKAIAVDCREDEKGNSYWLKSDVSISFNINMHSPVSHPENNVYTYNGAHVYGSITGEPFHNTTLTSVLLHYATPEFHKTSFPKSGADEDHRTGVVNKSVINYSLEITNPDDSVSIHNVVVEDVLDSDLTINNTPQVKIGSEDPVSINKAPIISGYEVSEDEGIWTFTATVSAIAPEETITIIVPATVKADLDAPIDNTATIISANGLQADIDSETTYHYVTVTQARIKKVDSKGDGLAGAQLQIYKNTSANWDPSTGKLKEGATPEEITINGADVTTFTSTTDVITFDLVPGDYILHEVENQDNIPLQNGYKLAADIPFTIDIEGITYVNNTAVNDVEMVDEPAYKIIFHENKPGGSMEDKNKEFRVFEPKDLTDNKIEHFYDIPEWAGDEYVFKGWYHSSTYKLYSTATNIDQYVTTASIFETDTFTKANATGNDANGVYHIYGMWIPVGTVAKDASDNNQIEGDYRGFGLEGVQVRLPWMMDENFENVVKPAGLRFVTSMSQTLFDAVNSISTSGVEYGYVVGTEENINTFTKRYDVKDLTKYKLQYKDTNVNGVDTTGLERTAETDYRYITNVNCTSRFSDNNATTVVPLDHRNYTNYRLFTLVVTYEGEEEAKADKINARAYIRYTDANGWVRVFYNDYRKNMYNGGCLCSYNQVQSMAIPVKEAEG